MMNTRILLAISGIFLLNAFLPVISTAQDNTLLTIGENNYSIEEFDYIFDKNNSLSQEPLTREEYVPIFVNYKLKVNEAMAQGYDTMPSFKNELEYYYNELAKPYLTDKKATDAVIKEAYEHLLYEVDASHILIKLSQSATPEDTLEAYNRIKALKELITDEASFAKIAREHSEGPSSKNGGRLGYFTGFMMVYPFEKAAFTTEPQNVSNIVRTSFGYHLIYVHDKRKNPGEIKVAHIMKIIPPNAPLNLKEQAKTDIDSVYSQLLDGAEFSTLVQAYSDDKNTLQNNGELPWFGTGRMVPEFAKEAFALQDSAQISKPIQTPFGWHIIKLIEKRPIAPLEEQKEDILQKIKRDERAYAGQKATIEKLRAEYKPKYDRNLILDLKKGTGNKEATNISLCTFADQTISSDDFLAHLDRSRIDISKINNEEVLAAWESYMDTELLAYEKSVLKNKYPDFRYLMNEYHDGLLIFEISQKEIWNKASTDTLGLSEFFIANKEKYRQEECFEGTLYFCKKKKDYKKLQLILSDTSIIMNDSLKKDIQLYAKVEKGTFKKGQYPLLDQQIWGSEKQKAKDYKYLLRKGEHILERERELNEVRGMVMSDYQTELEKNWVEALNKKYNPQINTRIIEETKQ
ncbi:peptidylprolyl isomerase [Carboxylicivirga sp. N1Y90]|uniref:peptidylprolyl isomerase n=1 Tax=Carboxylicivirga fragile TaxID=3417571 RepID=UPI003D34B587|nr:peptidylprolyl isomerase [Marinilabiliaceae bacterium N1Y90]